MWDHAEIINGELKGLMAAGCKVIQVEEPLLHFFGKFNPPREEIDFLVDTLNREIDGLDDCEVWVHTCWGNPNMQRVGGETPYAPVLEDYLYRVKCDVLTVEMCDRSFDELDLFGRYRDAGKKIAIGAISHRNLQVETDLEIAENIRRCLDQIDADKLIVSSDCGFGRAGFNRVAAYHKAAALVRGTNIVRAELGVAVTAPRNDDVATQLDIPGPSREPAQH
jgi:5-methyltetrahydropteroyltriglutamate--homocysteine methyltransferase